MTDHDNNDDRNPEIYGYSNDSDGYILFSYGDHQWQYDIAEAILPGQPVKVQALNEAGEPYMADAYIMDAESDAKLSKITMLIMRKIWAKVQDGFEEAYLACQDRKIEEELSDEEYAANVILSQYCGQFLDFTINNEDATNEALINDRFSNN